ncbi:MAG TPA: hypothetical protein VEV65_01140 [Kineosporiaceae bacterium]|nr:hypothetical protein [Kineosporiaceae bacterium]
MGRHGGRSGDHRDLDLGIDDNIGTSAGVSAPARSGEEVKVRTPLAARRWWEDGQPVGAAPAGHTWWDDAPVPPPVVVASADGRTPAVSFTPDADPFSAGGLFAPPAAREGEPAVVVHAAPDAAVSRGAHRARSTARTAADATGTHRDVVTLLRERDGGPDTGSLVRPYVALADLAGEGGTAAPPPAPAGPDEEVAGPREVRRARRGGGPLDRIIEVAPPAPAASRPVGEWPAPWAGDQQPSSSPSGSRSLFEPVTPPPTFRNAWAAPSDSPLPSRKALRARERASASGAASALDPAAAAVASSARDARITGRRLAKSGVLAVTAVGVVAASAPNAFSALGWQLPTHTSGAGTPAALVSLAGSGALPARDVTLGSRAGSALLGAAASLSSPQSDNAASARKDAVAVDKAMAAAAARAGAVASGAGRTLVDVARDQVAAEAERKAKIAQQVSRNVIRDPRAYARLLLAERGWSSEFTCLNLLWNRESGWNYQAYNPSSGAYGIPQALPGSKMASIAPDWRTNPGTQIKWGLNYIAERYGTPCGAWGHSQATGWY